MYENAEKRTDIHWETIRRQRWLHRLLPCGRFRRGDCRSYSAADGNAVGSEGASVGFPGRDRCAAGIFQLQHRRFRWRIRADYGSIEHYMH